MKVIWRDFAKKLIFNLYQDDELSKVKFECKITEK